jgi:hypothetical protein
MRERLVLMNELDCSNFAGTSSPYRIEEELPQGGRGANGIRNHGIAPHMVSLVALGTAFGDSKSRCRKLSSPLASTLDGLRLLGKYLSEAHDQVISKTLKLQRPRLKRGIVRCVCTESVPDYRG